MALSGLDIYKHLPKTNCKKCGCATCLAFAMALAAKKTSLDKCPDITEAAKQILDSASLPPMATITIGSGTKKIDVGGETVMFRHDKTFYHPTAIAVSISDNETNIQDKIEKIKKLNFDRVGMMVGVDLIALKNDSNNVNKFASVSKELSDKTELPLILLSDNPQAIDEALKNISNKRPLIYSANSKNYEQMSDIAKKHTVPLCICGKDVEELSDLSQKITARGVKDIVLDSGAREVSKCIQDFTKIRRLALKKNFRALGFPTIGFAESVEDASAYITKYANILVTSMDKPEELLPLVTLRLNIYTDPQKPIMMEPKLYSIGTPNENSPFMVTTNFSLTFFTVSPEVENSKIPVWLLVCDAEGMSVLTAWAADKFNAEIIDSWMKKTDIASKVKHKKIIIPGYVSVMSGKLEELTGWEVLVGPKEAAGIPKYLKTVWK
ncbi:MAG: acetyl-CoA decarbonylase/synthase complex subunit gamma [Elusimicrobia bacterium RIFOXYD2_FULL_34_15]|nr:MAG: acetyl-CoA decarbonylase/synthase complex subunit gamma [Elusimicrobia bacterium RIFOXYD2_FULL_34_15]